jgi:hypothetical protein
MRLDGVALLMFVGVTILLAGISVVLSAVFLRELSRLARLRRRHANPRSDFLDTLLRGLASGAIKDISDAHNSYRAFFGIGILRASHLEEIADALRGAMSRMASGPGGSSDARRQKRIQVVRELLAVNQRALEVELQCVPFSGAPEPERQHLEEILHLVGEDKTRFGPKLDALAKAIRIRQDSVERLHGESGRALRLARWGWVGTAGFSILSIILGILSLGG